MWEKKTLENVIIIPNGKYRIHSYVDKYRKKRFMFKLY